jgi:hypothetical protein
MASRPSLAGKPGIQYDIVPCQYELASAACTAGVSARRPFAVAVAALAVLLAACSSPATPGAAKPAVEATAPASPAVSAAPVPLTGLELDSALAPASSFPGFTANTKDTYWDGFGVTALPTQYKLARVSCTKFTTALVDATDLGQTAYAWAPFTRSAGDQTYYEFIYEFAHESTASSFIQTLRSGFGRCHSYADVEAGTAIRTTYDVTGAAAVDGAQAMQIKVTAAAAMRTAAGKMLYVLSGDYVYGVIRAGLTAVPADPVASAVIGEMMKQVQKMSD